MTDRGAALWLLLFVLSMSACVNVSIVFTLIRPWWVAIRDGANGPKTVILRGAMRRRLLMIVIHAALILQFGWRVVGGGPAPPAAFAVVFLIVVLGLIADGVGDMFDYRLLRGLLREDGHK
jgi:hypothetical protein